MAVPCALLTVIAIALLGPPLGHAFLAPSGEVIFPGVEVVPEPGEHGRYAVALLGPALFAAALALVGRQAVELPTATIRLLVRLSQAAVLGFIAFCVLAQYAGLAVAVKLPASPATRFFTPPTVATAVVCTLLLLAVLRSRAALARVTAWTRETGRRRLICAAVAVAYAADWLLRSINSDSTVGHELVLNLIPWEMGESFAVLNGRTPLVDFHSMYSHLWSDLVAGVLSIAGASVLTWTTTMATLSCLALLGVFGIFRRVVHSSLLALALFVPFTAISFWVVGSPSHGISIASIYSIWPLRYSGAYLLAWLTARHIDRAVPRQAWILFLAAGLVLINNLEFGLGACTATIVATALSPAARSRRDAGRLAVNAAIGLAGAAALVSSFTLIRTGQLPDFGLMLEFPQLFGRDGWGLEPMPTLGLHVAMYSTFAAAIAVAVARATRHAEEPVLTSMLGWAGTFGLLAATYYVGRSDPGNLMPLFSSWSFALALLLVTVVRSLLASPRRPAPLEVAVIFGFALAVASLPNMPRPWSQVARLGDSAPTALFEQHAATRFVAARTQPGEHVAILAPLGSRIAHDLGLVNVSPYVSLEAIRKPAQVRTTIAAIQQNHVSLVFLKGASVGEESGNLPAVQAAIEGAGFAVTAREAKLTALTARGGGS